MNENTFIDIFNFILFLRSTSKTESMRQLTSLTIWMNI